ncbi:MAG: histidine phosphatase family protein, partial [Rhodoferax sp.]|nr:histidine phosphatase family protein [Rhodoferax sp.]
RHFGRCEGMTLEEISHQYDDDARAIQCHDPDYASPGGGESRRQHQVRILGCIEHLVREHAGQSIVVVTHGGALDVIYRRARQLPLEAPRDYPIPNAGINWIGIDGEQWSIERWGDDAHLG